jgi:hypothetical protein
MYGAILTTVRRHIHRLGAAVNACVLQALLQIDNCIYRAKESGCGVVFETNP